MSQTDLRQRTTLRSSYFFLSYAHSPPLAGTLQADPDPWVRSFFHGLKDSVMRQAREPKLAQGFFDQEITLSTGWKASIKQALSSAEVFVPLLSPGYYTRSWPGKEWASFKERLTRAGLGEDEWERRCLPVLWIPLPGEPDRPGLRQALELGSAEPAYAENGLRTLLRLSPHQESYWRIVDRLAASIVEVASSDTLTPSPAPTFDEVRGPFEHAPGTAVFYVYVAAPSLAELPGDRGHAGYGVTALDWRPYPAEQELPLAEYASQVAEQLDFTVKVEDFRQRAARLNQPGVVLIDPWLAATEADFAALARFVTDLPAWVVPFLAFDSVADPEVSRFIGKVRALLGEPRSHTRAVSLAIAGVDSLKEFVSLMPVLVTEAERQYLRRGPVARSSTARRFWPRLTAGPVVPPHQEEHDA